MPAEYEIAADWDADGTFDGIDDDLTARVFDRGTTLTIRYGRDQARSLSPLAAGRAQFELDNRSRAYSPENLSSPLAGRLLPGRDIRVQATLAGTTYGLLRAYTDGYEILPDLEQRSVQITCLDAMSRLKAVRVSTSLYSGLRTGEAIAILLDAVGWDADLRDLDVGATVIPWWWVEDTEGLAALQSILDSEGPGSLAAVDIDGRIIFRDRHHRITRAASVTAQTTLRAEGAEPNISPPMVYDAGWADIINSITFAMPVRRVASELSVVWSFEGRQTILDGQTVVLAAQSSNPFFDAIVPEAGTDYLVVSGNVTMALSRTSGQSTTLSVTAVAADATIEDVKVRAYVVDVQTTAQVLVEDSSSITTYGRRSWPSDREPTYASLSDAAAIANIILAQRSARLPTVTVTLKGPNDARLVQQLSRDISDRVRIIEPETGLDADFYIEQIEHTIGENHVTKFGCEKAVTQLASVFILGDPVQGILGTNTLGMVGLNDPTNVLILGSATQGILGTNLLAY